MWSFKSSNKQIILSGHDGLGVRGLYVVLTMSGNVQFFGSVHAKLLIWLGKNGKW